jgi:hypothetical protein
MLIETPRRILPITPQQYTFGEQQVFNRYRSVILALLFANRIVGAPSVFICAVEVALRHYRTVKRASHLAFRRSQNSHTMVQATTIAHNGRIKVEAIRTVPFGGRSQPPTVWIGPEADEARYHQVGVAALTYVCSLCYELGYCAAPLDRIVV